MMWCLGHKMRRRGYMIACTTVNDYRFITFGIVFTCHISTNYFLLRNAFIWLYSSSVNRGKPQSSFATVLSLIMLWVLLAANRLFLFGGLTSLPWNLCPGGNPMI